MGSLVRRISATLWRKDFRAVASFVGTPGEFRYQNIPNRMPNTLAELVPAFTSSGAE